MIGDREVRQLALSWKDPREIEDDPDPLAELGRTGAIDVDGVLQALSEIELVLDEVKPNSQHTAELNALLEYIAEHGDRGPVEGWS